MPIACLYQSSSEGLADQRTSEPRVSNVSSSDGDYYSSMGDGVTGLHWSELEESKPTSAVANKPGGGGPFSRFQKATRKLLHVRKAIGSVGSAAQSKPLPSCEDKPAMPSQDGHDFLGKMLNYAPLMARGSKVLQNFHDPLFGGSAECDRFHLFGLLAQALHDIKKATIVSIWTEHLKPLEDKIADSQAEARSLRAQFKEARQAYLKEISELRDATRTCGDPVPCLRKDVFDPTGCLDSEESKFLLDVLREKLKMMMDNNSKVIRNVDLAHLERLIEHVESQESTKLRTALRRKSEEVDELRQAACLTRDRSSICSSNDMVEAAQKDKEFVSRTLNLKLEQTHKQKDELSRKLEAACKRVEYLEIECAANSSLKGKVEKLNMQQEKSAKEKTLLQEAVTKLSSTLHDREQEVEKLSNDLEKQEKLGAHLSGTLQAKEREIQSLQQEIIEGIADRGPSKEPVAIEFPDPSVKESCAREVKNVGTDMCERQEAGSQTENPHVEESKHGKGCGHRRHGLPSIDKVLQDLSVVPTFCVCKCRSLSSGDSNSCEKCGQECSAPVQLTLHEVIEAASAQLEDIAPQLKQTIEKPDEEAEGETTDLKHELASLETLTVVKHCANFVDEVNVLVQEEECDCNCFQALKIVMDLLRKLQVRSVEMIVRLKEVIENHSQLKSGLDSAFAELGCTSNVFSDSNAIQSPQNDGKSSRHVDYHVRGFLGLLDHTLQAKNLWKQKRQKYLEESSGRLHPSIFWDSVPQCTMAIQSLSRETINAKPTRQHTAPDVLPTSSFKDEDLSQSREVGDGNLEMGTSKSATTNLRIACERRPVRRRSSLGGTGRSQSKSRSTSPKEEDYQVCDEFFPKGFFVNGRAPKGRDDLFELVVPSPRGRRCVGNPRKFHSTNFIVDSHMQNIDDAASNGGKSPASNDENASLQYEKSFTELDVLAAAKSQRKKALEKLEELEHTEAADDVSPQRRASLDLPSTGPRILITEERPEAIEPINPRPASGLGSARMGPRDLSNSASTEGSQPTSPHSGSNRRNLTKYGQASEEVATRTDTQLSAENHLVVTGLTKGGAPPKNVTAFQSEPVSPMSTLSTSSVGPARRNSRMSTAIGSSGERYAPRMDGKVKADCDHVELVVTSDKANGKDEIDGVNEQTSSMQPRKNSITAQPGRRGSFRRSVTGKTSPFPSVLAPSPMESESAASADERPASAAGNAKKAKTNTNGDDSIAQADASPRGFTESGPLLVSPAAPPTKATYGSTGSNPRSLTAPTLPLVSRAPPEQKTRKVIAPSARKML